MRQSFVSWNKPEHQLPEPGKNVLVRVEVDGTSNFFIDFVDTRNIWRQSIDSYVTHWIYLPQVKCPTCGRYKDG